jgi:hypothetical protein
MVIRIFVAVVLLTAGMAEAKLKSAVDSNVIVEWGVNGQLFAVFKADGTGTGGDGPFRWTADGHTLAISDAEGTDRIPYEIKDGRLLVTIEGNRMVLGRMKTGGAKAEGRAGGGANADHLTRALFL